MVRNKKKYKLKWELQMKNLSERGYNVYKISGGGSLTVKNSKEITIDDFKQ